ncbi:MAG: hypothetical protein JWN88_2254 [Frankiales bacterium]|nr:hypothetical protein [Frankiales bacterium]
MLYRMCSECERSTVVPDRRLCLACAERLDEDLIEILSAPTGT